MGRKPRSPKIETKVANYDGLVREIAEKVEDPKLEGVIIAAGIAIGRQITTDCPDEWLEIYKAARPYIEGLERMEDPRIRGALKEFERSAATILSPSTYRPRGSAERR